MNGFRFAFLIYLMHSPRMASTNVVLESLIEVWIRLEAIVGNDQLFNVRPGSLPVVYDRVVEVSLEWDVSM